MPEQQLGYLGDPRVLENLVQRRNLREAGDPAFKEIKIHTYWEGKGMKSAELAGRALTLERKRLVADITSWSSVSGGTAVGLYTLAGLAELGASLIPNEFVSGKFISPTTPWELERVSYLRDLWFNRKPTDMAKLLQSDTQFLIAVTDPVSGKGEFIDIRSADRPEDLVLASLNWGFANGGAKTIVNNTPYIDGAYGCSLPVYPQEDQVLYFLSGSPLELGLEEKSWEIFLEQVSSFPGVSPILKGFLTDGLRSKQRSKTLIEESMAHNSGRACIFSQRSLLTNLTMDPGLLNKAIDDSALQLAIVIEHIERKLQG